MSQDTGITGLDRKKKGEHITILMQTLSSGKPQSNPVAIKAGSYFVVLTQAESDGH